jgi:signal transduction histidine kinase
MGSISLVGDSSLGPLNEQQKKFLDISLSNINRLTRLINDILDIQKMNSGELEYNMVPADINSLVDNVSEIMRFQAQQKGLKLFTETDTALPGVSFDEDKLTQVLTNLISNAIKFTENGFIKITTKKMGNMAEVSVQDTGGGINEDDMRYLFKPFRQINRKVGGTGLGLVISKRIIEKHGGRIWAESHKGEGSIFHFEIPIVERRRTA